MGTIVALHDVAQLASELIDNLSELIGRLHVHGVRSAIIVHAAAGAAVAAAACLQQLRQVARACECTTIAVPDSPVQQLLTLRVAADWLSLPLESITVVSISSQPDSEEAAARLGLRCLRLPPAEAAGHWLQAATLQAVATAAAAAQQALLVGYVMKHSRQLALEKAGMLPLLPTEGLCFAPLVLSRPLADQAPCRLLLHKLTDSLQPSSSGAGGSSAGSSGEVAQLSPEAQRFLQQAAQAEAATGVRLVDPMPAVQRVIDRAALAELLDRLTLAVRQAFIPMRSPAWTLVEGFDPVTTPAQLAAAHVRLPCIVKPRAACGVAEAHQMAFVLAEEGFAGLEVPLPAVVQEYVDHGGRVWKVYVAGSQVFSIERKSTPDLAPLAAQLAADPQADIPAAIDFDSLRSLPTSLPWGRRPGSSTTTSATSPGEGAGSNPADPSLPSGPPVLELLQQPETLETVVAALRRELGLALFGFDLVFDPAAGELVIVDLNYFPSFGGIPEAPAALRAALSAAAIGASES